MFIGIDFGTCYSSVSVQDSDKQYDLLEDLMGKKDSLGIPTQFMHINGENYFGEDWKLAVEDIHDVIKNVKTTIREKSEGFDFQVVSGGEIFSLRDITKLFLKYLLDLTLNAVKSAPQIKNPLIEGITITAPVGIDDNVRAEEYNKTLKEIISELLPDINVSNIFVRGEPVSAAVANLNDENIDHGNNETLVVFDLGGGTLDISAVKFTSEDYDCYEVLATDGDLHLGGNDWDKRLADYVRMQANIPENLSYNDKINFEESITAAKVALTTNATVNFEFMDEQYESYSTEVSRIVFDEITSDLLNRSIDLLRSTINSSSLKFDSIDRIVLVGGSCNMPQVIDAVRKEFSELDPNKIEKFNPSHAISEGAAKYASLKVSSSKIRWTDICFHSYGINLKPDQNSDFKILNLIFRNTKFENFVEALYEPGIMPETDNKRWVRFEIFESDILKEQCDSLGFHDIHKGEKSIGLAIRVKIPAQYWGKAMDYHMYPSLRLDSNGILTLEIKDQQGKSIGYKTKNILYD